MKPIIILLPITTLILGACGDHEDNVFQPVEKDVSVPSIQQVHAPSYKDQIESELSTLKRETASDIGDVSTGGSVPGQYPVEVWLHNSTMEQSIATRMLQNVEITAPQYLQPGSGDLAQRLSKDHLRSSLARATIVPALRTYIAERATSIELRRANEIASEGLVRRFLLNHLASTVPNGEFLAFLKTRVEISTWRSAAVASIAYDTGYATIEQASLSLIPKIWKSTGHEMSTAELTLLDKRSGALAFARVAFCLRDFSDEDVYRLRRLLTAEPQLRKVFELTAIGIARTVEDLNDALEPRGGNTTASGMTTNVQIGQARPDLPQVDR